MARPQKEGLDYFPLDVDIADDDKMELIEAKHGLVGFAVIVRLLMRIYKNGYYYKWTEKEQLLFSKRISVDINLINEVISDAVRWELFDKKMLNKHGILTSKGIQKRYLEAVKRRQKVELLKNYLLLKDNCLNEYTNIDIVDSNSIDDDNNPQSKVKESKGKESTMARALFNSLWQKYPRKMGKAGVSDTQKVKLLKVGEEHLLRCINRFTETMIKEDRPIDKYPYGSTFFNSGYVDYLDENFTEAVIPENTRCPTCKAKVDKSELIFIDVPGSSIPSKYCVNCYKGDDVN